jgi:hypothetical protein
MHHWSEPLQGSSRRRSERRGIVPLIGAALIGAGGSIASSLIGRRGGGGGKFKSYRPQGYLTAEDYAGAERTRGRLTSAVGEAGRGLRLQAMRRYQQRGLAGSAAQEATLSRIGETEALGRENAGAAAEDQLYNVRMGRELQDLEQFYRHQNRQDLARSTFLNSLLELTPGILKFLDRGNVTGDAGGGGDYSGGDEGWRDDNPFGQGD